MATVKRIKRKSGDAYIINFVDPYTGKRRRVTKYCDERTAKAIAKELEAKKLIVQYGLEGQRVSKINIRGLAEPYIENIKKYKAEKTVEGEWLTLKTFIGLIGNVFINSIRQTDIEKFMRLRLDDKKSPYTVAHDLRNLKVFFNYALKNNYIQLNPVMGIRPPKGEEKHVKFLTLDEVSKLLAVIDNEDFKDLIICYLHTGARRNEILFDEKMKHPLTWDRIDFDSKRIGVVGKGNKPRFIPMNDTVFNILQSRRVSNEEGPFKFKPFFVTHKLQKYYKKAGIQGACTHTLRKTFGSLLIQNDVSLFKISKALGHESQRITENHYVDLLHDDLLAPVRLLDDILNTNKDGQL